MKVVRRLVFETNSSSTHSLCICTRKEYEDWVNGKAVYNDDKDIIVQLNNNVTDEDINKKAESLYSAQQMPYWKDWKDLTEKCKEPYRVKASEELGCVNDIMEYPFETHEKFYETDLYTFLEKYTTSKGEELIVFGRYGYDG